MAVFRRRIITFIKVVTVVFLFFYLPSCFVYLVPPGNWWLMGVLGIAFPYLWLFLLLLVIVWIFIRRQSTFILFLLLLCGLPVMKNVFALKVRTGIIQSKPGGQIRLMQWNCNSLPGYLPYYPEQIAERKRAVEFILKYQPDIICIQDFANTIAPVAKSNIALMQDSLGYRYYVFTQHYKTATKEFTEGMGIAIFSKFPIIDSGKIFYPGKKMPESVIWAGFDFGGKKLRIATTHFQSMHISGKENSNLSKDLSEDSLVILHGNTISKLSHFQVYHASQALTLMKFTDTCRGPLILTGDLNSVPSSFVYKTVRDAGLQDVFLGYGFGFGKTYHSLQPALRIDYIFHNQQVEPSGAAVLQTRFSDHDPLIMDFSIR